MKQLFLWIFLSSLVPVALGASGLYSSDPNIYELTPKNFDKVVSNSNYTTIVKFYAPWCGYCKQIESVYHKLGKFFTQDANYAVNVAAVNCDKASNKPLCSKHRVQGYPTIMVFRPPKFQRHSPKSGKHVPEVYNGQRELPAMVDFVNSRLKNYVKKFHRLTSSSFVQWLHADDNLTKVVLLTNSTNISPLLKTLAIDFLETASVASVSVKNAKSNVVINYEDDEIEVPMSQNDSLPLLLVYDRDQKKFERYNAKKPKKLEKIERFVADTAGIVPKEGPLSRRGQKIKKYRGVKDSLKDEL